MCFNQIIPRAGSPICRQSVAEERRGEVYRRFTVAKDKGWETREQGIASGFSKKRVVNIASKEVVGPHSGLFYWSVICSGAGGPQPACVYASSHTAPCVSDAYGGRYDEAGHLGKDDQSCIERPDAGKISIPRRAEECDYAFPYWRFMILCQHCNIIICWATCKQGYVWWTIQITLTPWPI